MSYKEAFLLSYYDMQDNKISLKGRVLSEIKVSDILLFFENEKNISKKYYVEKILAYRHEFDLIDEGMTCEIIVNGQLIDFNEDSIFYI